MGLFCGLKIEPNKKRPKFPLLTARERAAPCHLRGSFGQSNDAESQGNE